MHRWNEVDHSRDRKFDNCKTQANTITNQALPATNAFVVSDLPTVAKGIDDSQRVGRKIIIKRIIVQIYIHPQTALLNHYPGSLIGVCLAYDKQTNGATATWTDIFFQSTPTSDVLTENRNRWIILKHCITTIDPMNYSGANTVSVTADCTRHLYFDLEVDLPVIYKGTGGSVTNIETGNVLLMFATTNPLNTTDYVDFEFDIYYQD